MRTRRAYISSLGTTGVLVAFALVILTIVGAFVAFDRWPNQAVAEPTTVQVGVQGPRGVVESAARAVDRTTVGGTTVAARTVTFRAPAAALRRVAREAGSMGGIADAARRAEAPAGDPVVSDLPAPDTAPAATATTPGSTTGAPVGPVAPSPAESAPHLPLSPEGIEPAGDGHLSELTAGLSDTIGGLSPTLGAATRSTSSEVDRSTTVLLGGGG
jgi:hypothetical protein